MIRLSKSHKVRKEIGHENFTIKAYCESVSDFKIFRKEIPISVVEENFWSSQYSLHVTAPEDTDRIQVACCFHAEEAYSLDHERQILPLSSEAFPPFPVGCILWLRKADIFCQVDLPKYPHLRLFKKGDRVTAEFVIQDRFGSGLIFWGDHKIRKARIEKQIYIRANRLRSFREAVWLEPYPNGARSVICLTDHPDFDTVRKVDLLAKILSENGIRITKGVFPSSDRVLGKDEPGLDVPEYKKYIDLIYESGSEIAFHGVSPRTDPPPISECLRRIDLLGRYSPKTWIDHGCGAYLFSRDAVFSEGDSLVDVLSKAGVENYWSYTDIWENPARRLDVWKQRRLSNAFSNFISFLWLKKRVSAPLFVYYGSSVLKNLLGPFHLKPIVNEPWSKRAWKDVAVHTRRLKYFHENPMVLYDLHGQSSLMSSESIWVFDTMLLNHLAFQLRPANIDLLCKQNGLLLAHCYFGHQKNRYGTINCFVNDGNNVALIPDFVENIKYIAEKQREGESVTLSFQTLRISLTNFANASLRRTPAGWEINGRKMIVVSQEATSVPGQNNQWWKGQLCYTEVEGCAVMPLVR